MPTCGKKNKGNWKKVAIDFCVLLQINDHTSEEQNFPWMLFSGFDSYRDNMFYIHRDKQIVSVRKEEQNKRNHNVNFKAPKTISTD